ncbi:MAG TPA: TIGR03621 family F420-dependent LLM class oxidoreductase [Acidimicrobiales bacterium]|nr:TIGR03621 family F420-dependent LLM class oxidoreductase [Acidimicrobiales bacterium]
MTGFRFGYQVPATVSSAGDLRGAARDAEAAGFDVLHTSDHVDDTWGPLAPLLAVVEATETLRVCPLVLNNDFYHPVHLARELASIDHLSGGRIELGIGAGHAFPEYAGIGAAFDPPAKRKARLAEAVEILRHLLDGDEVTFTGEHYQLEGVRTMRALQERLPILVGVNGRSALTHAARHADIVGLTGLGRTLEYGQRHEVRWEPERLDRTVAHIRAKAGVRRPAIHLHALVQVVVVTDDRRAAADHFSDDLGVSANDALATPFLALGTTTRSPITSWCATSDGASTTSPFATSKPSVR